MTLNVLRLITTLAIILAFLVVTLGAYTRLTDAGLGCPDWPGCYGHMVLPSAAKQLQQAQANYPLLPIESRKAWTEMVHRYAAGTLALLIGLITMGAVRIRLKAEKVPIVIPALLVILVVFQALLGMWTVTLKLLPVVVMGHLMGGMLIFASLCFFRWQLSEMEFSSWLQATGLRYWVGLGAILVLAQIALGGWVSSNYAGIACIGFPQCNGQWWPSLHFSQGFNLFSPVGANYQGGVLDNNVRVTIQFIHRLGAVVTAAYVLLLALIIGIHYRSKPLRWMAAVASILVLIQFTLGVLNVMYLLPLGIAVAHNGVAALLLAAMVSLLFLARGKNTHAY
jgi:cytochrome c oxidase assembly protein subunit 15